VEEVVASFVVLGKIWPPRLAAPYAVPWERQTLPGNLKKKIPFCYFECFGVVKVAWF